ncbi:MAG: DUF4197 domain-containing protein [Saprospiraceae bacterium]|nr:DUF4197 domain-containing protein [Saprospiraceae bacterium]
MRSYLLTILAGLSMVTCSTSQIQDVLNNVLGQQKSISQKEAGQGLKAALEKGISEGAERLSSLDGYYKHEIYKILLPEEAQPIIDKLRVIPGFSDFEEKAILKINRAAEDAAKKAKPIFVSAIKQMTFRDAMDILLGQDDAATDYLHKTTYQPLYDEFKPVIVNALNENGALDYWASGVNAYNKIPFVKKQNPELDDYVTQKALFALFDMVEKEERAIRTDVSRRTSDLLKRVFAVQD